jgi:deazaflavin-dependent oxidoreductase (nitroreductase family)
MGGDRNLADRMRPLRRLAGHVEATEVRLLGRSLLSVLFRQQVLALETTGRRSGKRRRTTVAYREQGSELVVVGGAGGQTCQPDWVVNLRADPDVTVSRRRRTADMTAHVLEGEERQRVWDELSPGWPMIAKYQERAGHPIPVITLTPRPTTNTGGA